MRVLLGVLVAALLAACTDSESTPATTPTTTGAPSSSTTPSTTAPPTTTTTTEADRLAEIQAIFQDLEERRLDALYRGDVEAFSELFANEAYLEQDLQSFELVEFIAAPNKVIVEVTEVVHDDGACAAMRVETDYTDFFGAEGVGQRTVTLEASNGEWGFSYVGEGWECAGPHPLEG